MNDDDVLIANDFSRFNLLNPHNNAPRITPLGRYKMSFIQLISTTCLSESDFDNEYKNYIKFGWEPIQPKYYLKRHLL
jgi:hypothetical protein